MSDNMRTYLQDSLKFSPKFKLSLLLDSRHTLQTTHPNKHRPWYLKQLTVISHIHMHYTVHTCMYNVWAAGSADCWSHVQVNHHYQNLDALQQLLYLTGPWNKILLCQWNEVAVSLHIAATMHGRRHNTALLWAWAAMSACPLAQVVDKAC